MTDDAQRTRHSSRIEVEGSEQSGDQFFFSPDVGHLVQRGDFLYTQYGAILPSNAWVRMMPTDGGAHENYADWTEEKRREVREAFEKQGQLEEIEETVRRGYRDALVERARTKLTVEEFDAVYDQGCDYGAGCR